MLYQDLLKTVEEFNDILNEFSIALVKLHKELKVTEFSTIEEIEREYGTISHEDKQATVDEVFARLHRQSKSPLNEPVPQILLNKLAGSRLKQETKKK